MKRILFTALSLLAILTQPAQVLALDDHLAFSGLTATQAIYDVRSSEEIKLQLMLKVIRDTYDGATQQGVKQNYIVSMRGPTVKMLVRERLGDEKLQKETVALLNQLNQRGVRMEACGYALKLFGVEPEDLYKEVHAVGNSLNSLIGYQTRGYALVQMN